MSEQEGYPRGRDTSSELVEVRCVLSRAEGALAGLAYDGAGTMVYSGWDPVTKSHPLRPWEAAVDPERGEMKAALAEVVRLLERWRRTGRPLKKQVGK